MKKTFLSRSLNWCFSIFAIFSLYPYIIWDNTYVYKALFLIIAFLSFIILIKNNISKINLKIFLVILAWILYATFPREADEITLFSTGMLSILIFSLLPDNNKLYIFEKFKTILCIILAISIIQYPMIVLGVVSSAGNLEPFSDIKISRGQFYINYIFNIVLNDQHLSFGNYTLFRFSSIFDEPGLVGSICAILYFTYPKNSRKNNIEKIVLIISTILSFSLGGYILFLIGCFINLLFNNTASNKRNFILLMLAITIGLLSLSSTEGGRKYITDRIWSDNTIAINKNNRVDDNFDKLYSNIYSNPIDFTFGLGKDAHAKTGFDVSSYKGFIYNYGIIGVLLILYMFIYVIIIKKCSLPAFVVPIIIIINSLQRPIEFNFYYYLIFLSVICYYEKNKKS
ncbi:hypothetical protein EIZ94_22555 [Escherichia coli]|uniref:hypothetical protein n=1 Tax=Escherichia coli TaxID=562 RepID=UPI00128F3AD2|nr:hypothetical protein [Escherichia coli]MQK50359.1 hypothetical protein [Escherichia coli]HAP3151618.1 hypothetical protein [Escherichia coli]HAW2772901.1 hypothetical protein [Escherichia coli]